MSTRDLDDLQQRIDALAACLERLAQRLETEVALLRTGVPPVRDLAAEIEGCANDFASLDEEVRRRSGGTSGEAAHDLAALGEMLARVRTEAVAAALPAALAVLKTASSLEVIGGSDGSLLAQALETAEELSCQLSATPTEHAAEISALCQGKHPIARLVDLVTKVDSLDNAQWNDARQGVEGAFGAVLSAAASRGRLRIAAPANERSPSSGTAEVPLPASPSLPASTVPPHASPPPEPEPVPALQETPPKPPAAPSVLLMASAALGTPPLTDGATLDHAAAAVWTCLRDGRRALAFQIGAALGPVAGVPATLLLEALALAPHLTRADGAVAQALSEAFGSLPLEEDTAYQLLAVAAVLRPALLAPSSGAAEVALGIALPENLGHVNQLLQALVALTDQIQIVDAGTLKGVRGQAIWESEKEELRQRVVDWCNQAPKATILFAAATNVWRAWCRSGGPIDLLLDPVRRMDVDGADALEKSIETLANDKNLKRLVQDTEKQLGRRKGEEIEARALRQLQAKAHEAVQLARDWHSLLRRRPRLNDFQQEHLEQFRRRLLELAPLASRELDRAPQDGGPLATAAQCALAAVRDLSRLFDPDEDLPSSELAPAQLLGSPFLLAVDLPLKADGTPEVDAAAVLAALVSASDRNPSWGAALDARVEQGDLANAERIVAFCEACGDASAEDLQRRFSAALAEHRDALARNISDARAQLELAAAYRLLPEAQFTDYDALLIDLERGLDAARRFRQEHSRVDELRLELDRIKAQRMQAVRAEVEGLGLPEDDPSLRSIRAAVETGDLLTANEYLERLKAGEPIDSRTGRAASAELFLSFFPGRAEELQRQLEQNADPRQVIRRTLDAADGAAELTDDAGAIAEGWFEVKRRRIFTKDAIKALARGLGFSPIGVTVENANPPCSARLTVTPVRDREVCPIPLFGSQAGGKYRIVGLFGAFHEEEVVSAVGETAQRQTPTIVLYFGRLSVRQRRNLARLCREKRRSFLVVDDILLLHLATVQAHRLSTFFACTLPFTFAEPYVTSAGLLPVEMFYGRRRELDDLMDTKGAPRSFVYGGRQLGKTALLREAERSFHHPDQRRYAFWIDLKAEGLGLDREPDELWLSLGRLLKRERIVSPEFPEPDPKIRGRVESLIEAVKAFLAADPERRILLLLDEADAFLKADGKEQFRESERLKGLMESTSRHLKVVFAGLHNVLRSTEQANHPLAHLGDPINVGPFLREREWEEARALVKRPLESVGFRFESDELVTRILAQTNYYPNLIQLYCAQLLQDLPARASAADSGPPWPISGADVDRAFRNRDLRDAIRQRFHLTLQLDPRYEVIAYVIAFEFAADARSADGIPIPEIRRLAVDSWAAGFAGLSDRDFEVLLEEMEGLGVLRRLRDATRYTLRNPNLLVLMGQENDIIRVLAKERDLPSAFEPAAFRARRRDPEDPRRHPLTFQQEASLQGYGVSLAFGLGAAGVDELVDTLAERFQEGYLRRFAGGRFEDGDFERWLGEALDRAAGGTTVLVVDQEHAWDARWVRAALKWVERLHAESRSVRVLFVGNAARVSALMPEVDALSTEGARLLTLEPWTDAYLRQWLEDLALPAEPEPRRRVSGVTGCWPTLLLSLHDEQRGLPKLEQQLEALARSQVEKAHDLWRAFGLDLEERRRALKALLDYGGGAESDLSRDDVEAIAAAEGLEPREMSTSLRWAELLRIVTIVGRERWRLDPVVSRLLGA